MQSRNFKGSGGLRRPNNNSSGGNRRSFNSSPSRRKPFAGKYIDFNKFINKAAAPKVEEVQFSNFLFSDFKINEKIKKTIEKRGFKNPTPIQEKTIPLILEGKDVIGLANTGTGKTGAFLIPIIHKILENPRDHLLVVVPTRELAIQIQEEFMAFSDGLGIRAVSVVGGANIRPQIEKLRSRPNVVIGTPGRLRDLIERKKLNLKFFNNIVLDEADRMLDMGFIGEIKFLLSLVSLQRQTLFFSATLSSEIEGLVKDFLKDPVRISIRTRETAEHIDQDVVRIKQGQDKVEVLHSLLAQTQFEKVLVFSRTKHGAERLSRALHSKGFKSESIHGDKSHAKRQKALKLFKEDFVKILVATDVAARGLDIPNVSHVINFDVPSTYEDYIHRIGRTGRAGKTGIALTFIG